MGSSLSKSVIQGAEVYLSKLVGTEGLPSEDPFWLELFASFPQPLSKFDPALIDDTIKSYFSNLGKPVLN